MRKGKIIKRNTCRLCGSYDFTQILNLGHMPHAGNFLTKSQVGKEKIYPLRIWLCNNCSHLQVLDVIDAKTLFKDYRYSSSISLSTHFEDYAQEMKKYFLKSDNFVVEIGSNDGVLLSPLKKLKINVLGIDPAKNIAKIAQKKGVETIVDYFGEKTAKKIVAKKGKADAIFANNVLAHIDDLDDVFRGIKLLLKPQGILVFEFHYLPELISKLQYDFFYNEHLSYYSLSPLVPFLEKYGLQVFDVKKIPIHSGSVRVYVKFEDRKPKVSKRVKKLLNEEKIEGLGQKKYYKSFADKVLKNRKELKQFIKTKKRTGGKVVGYGASGRANTLLNFIKINRKDIDYIVDESPERQGRFTPGTHIPIVPPEMFRKDNVRFTVLFAWSYKDQIIQKERQYLKKGGKFIIPLPRVIIYP